MPFENTHALEQASKVQHPETSNRFLSELTDFGNGTFHGQIEMPVNGAIDAANALTNSHLPHLDLFDSKDTEKTIAGKIGVGIGVAANAAAVGLAWALI